MMTKTITGKTKDQDGFAPGNARDCDTHEDCLGWILCSHPGADEWCEICDSGATGPAWAWCPARVN